MNSSSEGISTFPSSGCSSSSSSASASIGHDSASTSSRGVLTVAAFCPQKARLVLVVSTSMPCFYIVNHLWTTSSHHGHGQEMTQLRCGSLTDKVLHFILCGSQSSTWTTLKNLAANQSCCSGLLLLWVPLLETLSRYPQGIIQVASPRHPIHSK